MISEKSARWQVLAVTGGEALYADMGHFGDKLALESI